jgi:hypothetical protein
MQRKKATSTRARLRVWGEMKILRPGIGCEDQQFIDDDECGFEDDQFRDVP